MKCSHGAQGEEWAGRQNIGGEVGRGFSITPRPRAGPERRAQDGFGFFSFFCLFWAFFALCAGCRAALFSAGLFRVVFCLGFFLFLWSFLGLFCSRCWASCCSFFCRALSCGFLLGFLLFCGLFWAFFALGAGRGAVMKGILSFLFFRFFLSAFFFLSFLL